MLGDPVKFDKTDQAKLSEMGLCLIIAHCCLVEMLILLFNIQTLFITVIATSRTALEKAFDSNSCAAHE